MIMLDILSADISVFSVYVVSLLIGFTGLVLIVGRKLDDGDFDSIKGVDHE
jgi:hypothetical protein